MKSTLFNNQEIDTNFYLDPGHNFLKSAIRKENEFRAMLMPSILTSWTPTTPGLLDHQTVKITIISSTIPGLAKDQCKLVGNMARNSGLSQKFYGHRYKKSSPKVAPWFAFAALSQQIPAGLKEVTVKDSIFTFLLFDQNEAAQYIKAVAGQTVVKVEREINGKKDTVILNIDWNPDRMQYLQEGTQAVEYARHFGLGKINSLKPTQKVVSMNLGGNTVEIVLQYANGTIIRPMSLKLGVVSLASAIQPQLQERVAEGTVILDDILDSLKEGAVSSRFFYGEDEQQVEYTDIFDIERESWQTNIMSAISEELSSDLSYIRQFLIYGGTAPLLGIDNPQFLFFEGEHNPQFLDVWGSLIWAEKNLLGKSF